MFFNESNLENVALNNNNKGRFRFVRKMKGNEFFVETNSRIKLLLFPLQK